MKSETKLPFKTTGKSEIRTYDRPAQQNDGTTASTLTYIQTTRQTVMSCILFEALIKLFFKNFKPNIIYIHPFKQHQHYVQKRFSFYLKITIYVQPE